MEKVQVSVFLPNDDDMKTWYAAVGAIPTSWPDISSIDSDYMRRCHADDIHEIRKQVRARCLWRVLGPKWEFLAHHLFADGPGLHDSGELEEKLFKNRLHRPGDALEDGLY